jgi:hypothetical protein
MFLNNFQSFIERNPSALWQASVLQRKVIEICCMACTLLTSYFLDDESKSWHPVLGEKDGAVPAGARGVGHKTALRNGGRFTLAV